MPEISRFFGISIYIYPNDHSPPHFHAIYGDYEVVISIETSEVIEGKLPTKQLRMVQFWAVMHQSELLDNFTQLKNRSGSWFKIKPLSYE